MPAQIAALCHWLPREYILALGTLLQSGMRKCIWKCLQACIPKFAYIFQEHRLDWRMVGASHTLQDFVCRVVSSSCCDVCCAITCCAVTCCVILESGVQVVDVEALTLQNVITFPPDGAFLVNLSLIHI